MVANVKDKILYLVKSYGSQRKLAKSLGINQSQISRYIKGTRSPNRSHAAKITKRYYYQTDRISKKAAKGIPDTFKPFIDKIKTPKHSVHRGKRYDKRPYVRYDFPLWRRDITDTTKIKKLMEKLKSLYSSIAHKGRGTNAQRLGLSISTDQKRNRDKKYYSQAAGREYSRKQEELDFLTTIIYARNDASTQLMFDELEEKLRRYLLQTLESVSLHDTDDTKQAKTFYVFFEEG